MTLVTNPKTCSLDSKQGQTGQHLLGQDFNSRSGCNFKLCAWLVSNKTGQLSVETL